MNVVVVLKRVPDTEAVIRPDTANPGAIIEDDVKFVLNPYDEYAVEEALTIAEETDGDVIGVSIGPEQSDSALRTALAMGVERAVLIDDPAAVAADVITQGEILSAAIRELDAGLILCGREVIDTQEDALAPAIAVALDLPHVLNAGKIEISDDAAVVVRDVEGGSLEISTSLPAVISCQKGLNDPRYPTLIAIKRSQRKEIKHLSLGDLGLAAVPPKSRIVALTAPPPRSEGVLVQGEPEDVVAQCIKWLADEAKLI